jgi:hypothetical protein
MSDVDDLWELTAHVVMASSAIVSANLERCFGGSFKAIPLQSRARTACSTALHSVF